MRKVIHIDSQGSGGGSGTGYLGVFANYTALITAYPTAPTLSLAYVQNSQGTAWLPGGLGGTFYSKGTYLFDGVNWVDGLDEVSEELQELINNQYLIKVSTSDTTPDYLFNKTQESNDLFKTISNPAGDEKLGFGLFDYNKPWSAVLEPTSGDDDSIPKRHRIGQIWYATSTGNFFIAKSLLTGAAVWEPIQVNEALKTKAGEVLNVSFAGIPKRASVVFTTPFADNNYSVSLTPNSLLNTTYNPKVDTLTKTASGFTISMSANNIINLTSCMWVATKHGEN